MQADHGSDIHLPVAHLLNMAAPQQANMVTPLPESQRALSSQLIDTEAATTADEFDPARSYLLDNHDPMFPSGGVSDDDDGHGMLFDDSRAAARSNLRLGAFLAHGAVVLHAHASFASTDVCKHRAALHQLCLQAHHLCKAAD